MQTSIVHKILKTDPSAATFILRIGLAIAFIPHGAQKLFGWFGGYGLEATGQWMASIGLEPGFLMALLAGSAEFFGGLALLLGVLTRPFAVVMAFTMFIALVTVHLGNGFFMSNNGYEYALLLLIGSASLACSGAGKCSVDRLLTGTK